MTAQTPAVLKSYFESGDKPTEQELINLIDSIANAANYALASALIGADTPGGADRTDSTEKIGLVEAPHYTNAEEALAMISAYVRSAEAYIDYGGGVAAKNTTRHHRFYTAADNTTLVGTQQAEIDHGSGVSTTGLLLRENGTLQRVTVGNDDSGGTGFRVLRIPN